MIPSAPYMQLINKMKQSKIEDQGNKGTETKKNVLEFKDNVCDVFFENLSEFVESFRLIGLDGLVSLI